MKALNFIWKVFKAVLAFLLDIPAMIFLFLGSIFYGLSLFVSEPGTTIKIISEIAKKMSKKT
jgi:hypothetical protein